MSDLIRIISEALGPQRSRYRESAVFTQDYIEDPDTFGETTFEEVQYEVAYNIDRGEARSYDSPGISDSYDWEISSVIRFTAVGRFDSDLVEETKHKLKRMLEQYYDKHSDLMYEKIAEELSQKQEPEPYEDDDARWGI